MDIFNGFFVPFFQGLFSLDIMVYPMVALTSAALFSIVYKCMRGERFK